MVNELPSLPPLKVFVVLFVVLVQVLQIFRQCGRVLKILDVNVRFLRGYGSVVIRMSSEYDWNDVVTKYRHIKYYTYKQYEQIEKIVQQ
jgi:hypothetical protein